MCAWRAVLALLSLRRTVLAHDRAVPNPNPNSNPSPNPNPNSNPSPSPSPNPNPSPSPNPNPKCEQACAALQSLLSGDRKEDCAIVRKNGAPQ